MGSIIITVQGGEFVAEIIGDDGFVPTMCDWEGASNGESIAEGTEEARGTWKEGH
jgi:hypothetical protein